MSGLFRAAIRHGEGLEARAPTQDIFLDRGIPGTNHCGLSPTVGWCCMGRMMGRGKHQEDLNILLEAGDISSLRFGGLMAQNRLRIPAACWVAYCDRGQQWGQLVEVSKMVRLRVYEAVPAHRPLHLQCEAEERCSKDRVLE